MKIDKKSVVKTIVESLETRQLLSAAVSSTEILANLSSTKGLDVISSYLKKNPSAGLNQYLSGKNKSLFTSDGTSTIQLSITAGKSINKALELIKKLPQVNWASPNYVYGRAKTEAVPNDPRYPNQTGQLDLIKAPQAWDTTTGTGVTIAVLDDGVDIDHEDLNANIWTNTGEIAGNAIDDDNNGYVDDVNGWDFGKSDNNPRPDLNTQYNFIDSHGTTVAGIAAGVINNNLGIAGVAGGAKIMPVRFTGSNVTVTSAGIASSIAYAANNGAKVINISFSIDPYQNDPAFFAATDLAYDKGCIWLNSAGNSNVENPPRTDITKAFFIANTNNSDVKVATSNYGSGIDLAAPGDELVGTVPGNLYDTAAGTSFSTAVTSGIAALIISAHPTWTRDQVAAQLVGSVDNIDALNPTYAGKLGAGRVNAFKAVSTTLAAPKLRGLVGITHGSVLTTVPSSFDLRTYDVLKASTVTSSNFELQYAGTDGVFNSGDVTIPLTLNTNYAYGTNILKLAPTGTLADGLYRFVAKSSITNPFDTALDGDGNGTAGDDYALQFTISAATATVNAPSNLTAVIPSYSQTEGEITWTDNSDNELNFVIERSSTSSFATIDKVYTAIGNSVRYNDWGLSQGNTYYYRIKAVGVSGSSAYSNTAVLNIPLPPAGIPDAPSTLTATLSAYSQTEAVLQWNDNSNNETGFVIERSLVSSFATLDATFNAVPGSNQYYDWGLTAGQTYYYRIKAVNGTDSSAYSNTATFTTPGGTITIPAAPSSLAAVAVSGSNTSIALSWEDNSGNETSFVLDRSTSSTFASITSFTLTANTTNYTDTGLSASTTYYYRLRASNTAGASANSNTATFTTPTAPTAPAAPTTLAANTISGSTTSALLTWIDASSNETGFELQRATSAAFTTVTTINIAANATSYTDTGLTTGATYYYRLRAVNAVGPSTYTATASITLVAPATAFGNAGFESPTTTTYIYNPTGGIWTFNTGSGVQRNGSAWNAVTAPQGVQTAFIQGSSGTLGSISQSLNLAAGTYTISFKAARRTNQIQPLRFSVDGVQVGALLTPTSNSFNNITTVQFTVTAGTHTIAFAATDSTGDKSTFIDDVTITSIVPTAPNAPSGLAAAAIGTTGARLTWTDNSSNETGFEVQVATNSTFTTGVVTTTVAANAVTTDITTGIVAGTPYFFRVRAINAVGPSAYSSTATLTIPATPAAPTGLAVVVSPALNTTANVSWVDASTNETGFELQRSTTSTFTTATTVTRSIAANATTFSETGLALNTTYYFRLRSINASGQSAYTSTITYRTPAATAPAAPSSLTAANGGSRTITLTWVDNSNNETQFQLVRSTNAFFIGTTTINVTANATSIPDNNLNSGTTYYYRIRAVNAVGNSSYSNTVSLRAQ